MLRRPAIIYLQSHPDQFVELFHLVIAMSTTQHAVCECPPHKKESVLTFGKQQMTATDNYQQETHIVLPDGGGIRGLAALLIVKELLILIRTKERNRDRRANGTNGEASAARTSELPLACHYFSFMFGTSTGG